MGGWRRERNDNRDQVDDGAQVGGEYDNSGIGELLAASLLLCRNIIIIMIIVLVATCTDHCLYLLHIVVIGGFLAIKSREDLSMHGHLGRFIVKEDNILEFIEGILRISRQLVRNKL